jgi:hypothetical protein
LGISPPILSKRHATMPFYHLDYQRLADLFRTDLLRHRRQLIPCIQNLGQIAFVSYSVTHRLF